jgi:hypothetical protein
LAAALTVCVPPSHSAADLVDDGIDLSVIPEFENVNNGPTLVHLFTLVHAVRAAASHRSRAAPTRIRPLSFCGLDVRGEQPNATL